VEEVQDDEVVVVVLLLLDVLLLCAPLPPWPPASSETSHLLSRDGTAAAVAKRQTNAFNMKDELAILNERTQLRGVLKL
jgi:hypothetical protein